jgi:ubiquinone/menaquinone biosynthesis C-methylase UbiE
MYQTTDLSIELINQLLSEAMGPMFGTTPMDQLEKISELKFYESNRIKKYLLLRKSDTVIDLGCGPGFVAKHLAGSVTHIHCVDVDKDFIQLSRHILSDQSNITYHVIQHSRLDTLPMVTAIYANQVFALFNLYEIYQYLTECHRVLLPNGRMMFEIINDEHLDVTSEKWQNNLKLANRLVYNNKNAVAGIIQQTGFDLIKQYDDKEHTFFILTKK